MPDRPLHVYLAGPMTGIAEFNFPAFNAAAARLRDAGHTVINPAELDRGDTTGDFEYYMLRDLGMILRSCHEQPRLQAIAVLPGWRRSRGANVEVTVGRALGLAILDADTLEPIDASVLTEAHDLVHGDRGEDYGHPADDFGRTAKIQSAILGIEVSAKQSVLLMQAVKISRECNRETRDNCVDGAGYWECLWLVKQREAASGKLAGKLAGKPDSTPLCPDCGRDPGRITFVGEGVLECQQCGARYLKTSE